MRHISEEQLSKLVINVIDENRPTQIYQLQIVTEGRIQPSFEDVRRLPDGRIAKQVHSLTNTAMHPGDLIAFEETQGGVLICRMVVQGNDRQQNRRFMRVLVPERLDNGCSVPEERVLCPVFAPLEEQNKALMAAGGWATLISDDTQLEAHRTHMLMLLKDGRITSSDPERGNSSRHKSGRVKTSASGEPGRPRPSERRAPISGSRAAPVI